MALVLGIFLGGLKQACLQEHSTYAGPGFAPQPSPVDVDSQENGPCTTNDMNGQRQRPIRLAM
jgi:hypothetical protein